MHSAVRVALMIAAGTPCPCRKTKTEKLHSIYSHFQQTAGMYKIIIHTVYSVLSKLVLTVIGYHTQVVFETLKTNYPSLHIYIVQ